MRLCEYLAAYASALVVSAVLIVSPSCSAVRLLRLLGADCTRFVVVVARLHPSTAPGVRPGAVLACTHVASQPVTRAVVVFRVFVTSARFVVHFNCKLADRALSLVFLGIRKYTGRYVVRCWCRVGIFTIFVSAMLVVIAVAVIYPLICMVCVSMRCVKPRRFRGRV